MTREIPTIRPVHAPIVETNDDIVAAFRNPKITQAEFDALVARVYAPRRAA